jgi:hypothetical protein
MSQFEQQENVNFYQKLCRILPTHLISQHAISFSSPLERKATWASISVGRGDRKSSLPQGKPCGTFLQIFFQQCFQQLYQSWQACIAANGDYFQGRCGSV